MSSKFCFILIITLCLLTSCSKNEGDTKNKEEVVLNDGYKSNEITIEEGEISETDGTVPVPGEDSGEITKVLDDNSKISILTDRYGNKVETRTFNLDPRLSLIVSRTSADGKKQVFIYGQNGEVKSVPENMWNKLLTAPADEIATAAGIYATRQQSFPTFAQNQPAQSAPPLQPLPSSNFPVQTRQMPQDSSNAKEEQKTSGNEVNSTNLNDNDLSNLELEN